MSLPAPSLAGLISAAAAVLAALGGFATFRNSRANRGLLEAQTEAAKATASQTSVSAAIALYQAVSRERDECATRLAEADAKLESTREEVRAELAKHEGELRLLREALRLRGVELPSAGAG